MPGGCGGAGDGAVPRGHGGAWAGPMGWQQRGWHQAAPPALQHRASRAPSPAWLQTPAAAGSLQVVYVRQQLICLGDNEDN